MQLIMTHTLPTNHQIFHTDLVKFVKLQYAVDNDTHCLPTIKYSKQAPLCMETDDRPWLVASVHYMYFAAGLFITTGVVTVVVSLCTDPPRDYNIVRTTFMTRHDQRVRKDEHEVIPFLLEVLKFLMF